MCWQVFVPPFLRMTPLPGAALPPVRDKRSLCGKALWWEYLFLLSRRLRPYLIFFEAKVRREQVQALQFFDMTDDRSLVHAELARYRRIRRRAVRGRVIEVAFDHHIDPKSYGTNAT